MLQIYFNMDGCLFRGSVFLLLFLFYSFISGLNYAFSSFRKEQGVRDDYPAGMSLALKRLLARPQEFSGMVVQFSLLLKMLLIFGAFILIKSPLWAGVLALFAIFLGERGIILFIRGREYLFLKRSCYFTLTLNTIAAPVNFFLNRLSSILDENREEREAEVMEEITEVEDNTDADETDEKKLLKGIVSLPNISVTDIMCPRVNIVAVNTSMSAREVMERAISSGYSRIPVYEDTLDNIKGFLYIKDLIEYISDDIREFDWYKHIRDAYFVPGSKKINDLLEEFRQKKMHLAMVVDEYGGTDGIVTLEDILEEIVGEIEDETD